MSVLNLSGLTLAGDSIAGVGTAVAVKQLKLCFDLGVLRPEVLSCNNVFVSHAHADHVGEVFNYLAVRALEHRTAASLFVPHSAGQALRELLRTFAAFAGSTFEYRVFDLHEGAAVPLKNGITVTPFATDHVIQTFGFLVEESVTKLRPECADLPQKQIAAARREGRSDVFYTEVRPILAYVPDTLPSVLDRLPDNAWKARILMIESSFLDDRKPLAKIRLGNHVRVDDVAQRVHRFQGENIVLFHFSRMYGRDEIPDLVAAAFPEPFKHRVHCFLPSEGFPL